MASRRALNRIVDTLRRAPLPAPPVLVVCAPIVCCDHCGDICGDETIYQARLTFKSESCYRAFVASLEAA